MYLKKEALDAKNQMLTLTDSFGLERQVHLSKKCVDLFQSAIQQTKYVLNNGYNPSKQSLVDLRDSDYLIKVSLQDHLANQSMITEMDSVILRTIYMRLRRLADFFSTPELTHLTTVKLEFKEIAYA
ncbi:hypothetical protein GK047_03345 [Paenibacillus sp. SYP-B3998]|uniref:MrpR C-terminal catalytic domain-containing protein n=1 Tax=Paenibacillus sp. SYP-B3998 TaxID=2678564 RepID=A0A6G3ZTM4_9BACL|nr:hypothetical protein [Paenibacillus sp. SYP-B3998]NEW05054.1 hypothetical protein [Paenibacillus sp. SYP-B3998]